MRFLLIHIIIVFSLSATFAQWDEPIIIDRPETKTGQYIHVFDTHVLIVASGWCLDYTKECCEVIALDFEGNELWSRVMTWLDITNRGILLDNDELRIFGNSNPEREELNYFQMNAITGDSIKNTIIKSEQVAIEDMFQLSSVYAYNKYWVAGTAELQDSNVSYIFVVDSLSSEVDTLLLPQLSDYRSEIWDLDVDHEGNVVAFMAYVDTDYTNFRSIIKFNKDHDIIWQYTSESDLENEIVPKGCVLKNNNILFKTGHPEGNSKVMSLRAITPDSTIAWQYDYENIAGAYRFVTIIENARDGGFYVLGRYGDQFHSPKIHASPYIAKFSIDGELIWERVFVSLHEAGHINLGTISNLDETEDGYIYVTGRINDTDGNILIMRLDQEGCLEDDCGLLSDITSTDFITMTPMAIEIYPNPTSEQLHIRTEIDMARYALYQNNGELVSSTTANREGLWNITHVPAGRYLLVVSSTDGRNHAQWVEIVE